MRCASAIERKGIMMERSRGRAGGKKRPADEDKRGREREGGREGRREVG